MDYTKFNFIIIVIKRYGYISGLLSEMTSSCISHPKASTSNRPCCFSYAFMIIRYDRSNVYDEL